MDGASAFNYFHYHDPFALCFYLYLSLLYSISNLWMFVDDVCSRLFDQVTLENEITISVGYIWLNKG